MATAIKTSTQYLERFTEFERSAAGGELPWLRKLRRESFAHFCEIGFPTTHDEDWRFTSVVAIANTAFRPASSLPAAAGGGPMRATADTLRLEGASCRLVFVNGRLMPEPSVDSSASGVMVGSLAQMLAEDPSVIEQHLGRYEDAQRDGFSVLNIAFLEDGAFVHIGRGVVVEGPIHLLFVSTLDEVPVMSHPRNLILLDENSQTSIVEEYIWLGGGTGLCNSVTEIVAGDGAVLSHFRVLHESKVPHLPIAADVGHPSAFNISTLRIQQGRSSNVSSHSVLLGGTLVRNNVHTVLAGEGGECLINGLFLCTGSEHIDNYMLVEHASPHCDSRQFYNGILDGHARGVFHGRIIVHKDAQKTDAKQTNRNLLLSDDAQIDTKPQLEIHADDVKCTHGATIGQIDEDALFYLRSRGIDEDAARKLLLLAFAEECLARMQEGAARNHLEALVRQHLLGFSSATTSSTVPELRATIEEAVWRELRTVFDPEIPVNIVDLGLIYACSISHPSTPDAGAPGAPNEKYRVELKMTLTAPGCAMSDVIKGEVERKLAQIPGVSDVRVVVTFDPPWDRSRMSEAAKLQLGFDLDVAPKPSELPIFRPERKA